MEAGAGAGAAPRLRWPGALETGKWPRTEARAAPPADDRHRSHLSQTQDLAPALRHISHTSPWGSEALRMTSHRGTPNTPPTFQSSPQPQALAACGTCWHTAPPTVSLPHKARTTLPAWRWWAQPKAPIPLSWRIACSQGPPWQAPRAQPPALLLNTGPRLGCLMIFSWWSSLLLHSSTYMAGLVLLLLWPGLVYWRPEGGLG